MAVNSVAPRSIWKNSKWWFGHIQHLQDIFCEVGIFMADFSLLCQLRSKQMFQKNYSSKCSSQKDRGTMMDSAQIVIVWYIFCAITCLHACNTLCPAFAMLFLLYTIFCAVFIHVQLYCLQYTDVKQFAHKLLMHIPTNTTCEFIRFFLNITKITQQRIK